ncbi:hypothetical protein [Pendulispora albinea]|uniref:Collagen-like protein n=1 Tax=Pendulispora albinea TaxID=2741071 RepID=A0ABZ2LUT1_9BACT
MKDWLLATIALAGASGCGIPPIDASKVQRLEVVSYDANMFCPTGPTKLDVRAKMVDGSTRATNAPHRSDQFDAWYLKWKVSPEVGKVGSNDLDVAFLFGDDISPALESNVNLSVAMRDNKRATGGIELTPNFACHQSADFSASEGIAGAAGSRGDSLWSLFARLGRAGESGENGDTGPDATHVEAVVTLVSSPKRGPLAAVRVTRPRDGRTGTYYVDPANGHITIVNRGGRGGQGGQGESGEGGSSGSTCARGSDGGDGGLGGHGGNGGTGGSVTVHFDARHPELASLVSVDNRGGEGGRGGRGGQGGSGGSGGGDAKRKCDPSSGSSGRAGSSGMPGQRGLSGPAPQVVWDPPESISF